MEIDSDGIRDVSDDRSPTSNTMEVLTPTSSYLNNLCTDLNGAFQAGEIDSDEIRDVSEMYPTCIRCPTSISMEILTQPPHFKTINTSMQVGASGGRSILVGSEMYPMEFNPQAPTSETM